MIAAIRIAGRVGLRNRIKETLYKLRLRRKYSCVVFPENKEETKKALKNIRDYIAYGEINEETLKELIEKRGKPLTKNTKIDTKKAIETLKSEKSLEESGIKPFFRLQPPRKGINTKEHFPKGILGDHGEKINDLIKRMLW